MRAGLFCESGIDLIVENPQVFNTADEQPATLRSDAPVCGAVVAGRWPSSTLGGWAMADKENAGVQADQIKLLAEAMKQPGVAVAAETYGRIADYSPAVPQTLVSTGYAVGGNA